jgi:hypothetical protein
LGRGFFFLCPETSSAHDSFVGKEGNFFVCQGMAEFVHDEASCDDQESEEQEEEDEGDEAIVTQEMEEETAEGLQGVVDLQRSLDKEQDVKDTPALYAKGLRRRRRTREKHEQNKKKKTIPMDDDALGDEFGEPVPPPRPVDDDALGDEFAEPVPPPRPVDDDARGDEFGERPPTRDQAGLEEPIPGSQEAVDISVRRAFQGEEPELHQDEEFPTHPQYLAFWKAFVARANTDGLTAEIVKGHVQWMYDKLISIGENTREFERFFIYFDGAVMAPMPPASAPLVLMDAQMRWERLQHGVVRMMLAAFKTRYCPMNSRTMSPDSPYYMLAVINEYSRVHMSNLRNLMSLDAVLHDATKRDINHVDAFLHHPGLSVSQKTFLEAVRLMYSMALRKYNNIIYEQVKVLQYTDSEDGSLFFRSKSPMTLVDIRKGGGREDPVQQASLTATYATGSWVNTMTIEDFLYKEFSRQQDFMRWLQFSTCEPLALGLKLERFDLPEAPTYTPSRAVRSYQNGVLNITWGKECFFFYTDRDAPDKMACKHYDCIFPPDLKLGLSQMQWRNMHIPWFEKILNDQCIPPKAQEIVYMSLGRMLYQLGRHDRWQYIFFLLGLAETGKSSVSDVAREFFQPDAVRVLSSMIEEVFGLSGIYGPNVMLFICEEVTAKFRLPPGDFKLLVQGNAAMSLAKKNKDPLQVTWDIPGLLLGNVFLPYVTDSVGRRVLTLEFKQKIRVADPTLPDKIRTEHPAILLKSQRAYHEFATEHSGDSIWTLVPKYYVDIRKRLIRDVNPIAGFILDSEMVDVDSEGKQGWTMKKQEFKTLLTKYVKDTHATICDSGTINDAMELDSVLQDFHITSYKNANQQDMLMHIRARPLGQHQAPAAIANPGAQQQRQMWAQQTTGTRPPEEQKIFMRQQTTPTPQPCATVYTTLNFLNQAPIATVAPEPLPLLAIAPLTPSPSHQAVALKPDVPPDQKRRANSFTQRLLAGFLPKSK